MAAGRNRPIPNLSTQDAQQIESSYRSWQSRRPQLFRQSSSADPMALNTKATIFVIADGQEQSIKLANTVHDSKLSKSIISKNKALSTGGTIQPSPSTTLTDHSGTSYISSSTVQLRWYYENGTQTFPESFYVVEDLPTTCDAGLRCTAESPASALVPQAHPHYYHAKGSDPNDRDKKDRREQDEKRYEDERKAQADRIRKAFALKQAGQKHG